MDPWCYHQATPITLAVKKRKKGIIQNERKSAEDSLLFPTIYRPAPVHVDNSESSCPVKQWPVFYPLHLLQWCQHPEKSQGSDDRQSHILFLTYQSQFQQFWPSTLTFSFMFTSSKQSKMPQSPPTGFCHSSLASWECHSYLRKSVSLGRGELSLLEH